MFDRLLLQLKTPAMEVPTQVKVPSALLPRVVIAPMQTTTMRASMTAYSTAVGPSHQPSLNGGVCGSRIRDIVLKKSPR
jgi:hypothetical protein